MLFLAVNDWWSTIQKFFHEMDQVVKILIITIFMFMALFSLIRFLKPRFSSDKNKFKIWPIICFAIFLGLACFIIFI